MLKNAFVLLTKLKNLHDYKKKIVSLTFSLDRIIRNVSIKIHIKITNHLICSGYIQIPKVIYRSA